jgi:hypothetical protein
VGVMCSAESRCADRVNTARAPGWVLPYCNSETMSLHLTEISLAVAPGAHAVVPVDQDGWHTTAKLSLDLCLAM